MNNNSKHSVMRRADSLKEPLSGNAVGRGLSSG